MYGQCYLGRRWLLADLNFAIGAFDLDIIECKSCNHLADVGLIISQGILVAFIVSGGVSGTFDVNSSGSHKTRAYMVFILAFMAITSIIRMFGALSYFFIWIFTG